MKTRLTLLAAVVTAPGARRADLNSTRVWLNYQGYEKDPQGYVGRLRNYVRTSHRLGFSTMPILWNGNNLNPDTLKKRCLPY